MHGGIHQAGDRIDHRRRSHRVGFNDIQAPAFAQGGVQQKMRLPEPAVFFRLIHQPGELDTRADLELLNQLLQLRLHIAGADNRQAGIHLPLQENADGPNRVIHPFVRRQPRHRDEPQRRFDFFRFQRRQRLQRPCRCRRHGCFARRAPRAFSAWIRTASRTAHSGKASASRAPATGQWCCMASRKMNPRSAPAPRGCRPRNSSGTTTAHTTESHDAGQSPGQNAAVADAIGRPSTRTNPCAAPDDFYSPHLALRLRSGKIVGKPINFVSAPDQFGEVGQADTLRAAGNRILRVAPVEHQKSHDGPGYNREIFSSNSVVDLPGTNGMITIFPPADSTARRSSWFNVSRV